MKQSNPNPLQQELARIPAVGPHPDFDQLTAFAEGKLLPREREEVLAHLASCTDCRELLSAAAGAREVPAVESKPFLMPRPSRPPLRTWLPWVSIAATILVAFTTVMFLKHKDDFNERATVSGKNPAADSTTATQPLPTAEPQTSTPTQSGSAFSTSEPAAPQDSTTPASRPHWRINDAGQPERSFADRAWRAVLPGEKSKMRVISVFNADVWIGGENTALYHSADNGVTWKQITLPQKNGSEHAITHIRFQTAQSIKAEAADGTTWTTADSGLTWK